MKKLLYILLFLPITLFGQRVSVSQVVYISDDDSYKSALEKGLKLAKSEALVKAGVTEYISEYTRLFTSEINDNINEVFNSDLLIHLGGTIKNWEYTVKPEKKFDKEKDSYYLEFEISAKIKKYKSKPDPAFKARIDGVNGSYLGDQRMEFSIYPYQNCYLTLFYISDYQAEILFPYDLSQETLIKANEIKEIDYLVIETNSDYETGRLITVITKEYYPFDSAKQSQEGYLTNSTSEDIFKWLLDIEPENRTEYYHQFVITK